MSHSNVNHDLSNDYNQGNWRCHRFNPMKCNNPQLFQQAFLLDNIHLSIFWPGIPQKTHIYQFWDHWESSHASQ